MPQYNPIYKDTYFTSASGLTYLISEGDNIVFSGRAEKSPSKPEVKIKINDKVNNYLHPHLENSGWVETDGVYVVEEAVKSFIFEDVYDSGVTDTFTFLNAYKGKWDGTTEILSKQVTNRVDPRMKIFWGKWDTESSNIDIEYGYIHFESSIDGSLDFDFSADTHYIEIEASGVYTAYTPDGWITITPSGDGYDVSVDTNTGEPRTGSVCVKWINGDFVEESKCYAVEQAQEHLEFEYSGDTYFTTLGGTRTVSFTANTEIEIVSVPYWITATTINGTTAGTITMNAVLNEGLERSGVIEVRRKNFPTGEIKTIPVSQQEMQFDIIVSDTGIPYSATSKTMSYTATLKPEIISYPSWVTAASLVGDTAGTITLTVEPNTGNGRTGTIVFGAEGCPTCPQISVNIYQGTGNFEFGLTGPATERYYPYDGGTNNIAFSANSEITIISVPSICPVSSITIDGTTAGTITLGVSETNTGITRAGSVVVRKKNDPYSNTVSFSIYQDSIGEPLTLDITKSGTLGLTSGSTYAYRKNYGNWSTLTAALNVDAGDRYQFCRASGTSGTTGNRQFYGTAEFNASNRVASMFTATMNVWSAYTGTSIYDYLFANTNVISAERLYLPTPSSTPSAQYTFSGCTKLIAAPQLKKNGNYRGMFMGCTSLETAPTLAGFTMNGQNQCREMFKGCTALTKPPVLPNNFKRYSYYEMFAGCTALATAPTMPSNSSTHLANYCCYGMFSGCTSLVTPPELPYTNYSDTDYQSSSVEHNYELMFAGCTSLTSTPTLQYGGTLWGSNYREMFKGCTAITAAPELPSNGVRGYAYYGMFSGCTSLVSGPSTILQNSGGTLGGDACGEMFAGCVSLTTAPALPFVYEISEGAFRGDNLRVYKGMFRNCVSLVQAPEIKLVNFNRYYSSSPYWRASDCCYEMFKGCTSLNFVKCLTKKNAYAAEGSTFDWLADVSPTGTFVKAPSFTWLSGPSGIPTGWTVEEE